MREEIASYRLMIIIQDEKVLLLHQFVKDFLVGSSAESSSGHFINEFEAHARLAHRCVAWLIQDFNDQHLARPVRSRHHISSEDRFLSYAIRSWGDHAHLAQSEFKVHDDQAEFFSVDSMCRSHWLELFRSKSAVWFINKGMEKGFSIFHVASRWDIPALVDYVYSREDRNDHFSGFNDLKWKNSRNLTPMEEAAKHGHVNVLSCLLNQETKPMKNYKHVIKRTVENQKNADKILDLLLNRRGDKITNTEEIVMTAARWSNKETMTLLLNRRGDQIIITEEIMIAAAGNYGSGEGMMTLLLNQRGDEITITQEIVETAAGNYYCGEKVITLLLDQRGDEITITEEIIEAATRNLSRSKKIMTLLFDRRGDEITITEGIVEAAAENQGKEMMTLLLDRRGDEITITEEIVRAATGNEYGEDIMTLLLDQEEIKSLSLSGGETQRYCFKLDRGDH
ncbi:hypothetical protein GJ744_008341 [Endocarpon pusillum]|uniref:Ankyrin repeat-containing protein n=1 Tax=Endocarpon pusillum TaxID=364733 RepID=A0A8H7AJ61_9EURO|nr:hypothetical protein GJ744_008341 [Endocarpon pusillum]